MNALCFVAMLAKDWLYALLHAGLKVARQDGLCCRNINHNICTHIKILREHHYVPGMCCSDMSPRASELTDRMVNSFGNAQHA